MDAKHAIETIRHARDKATGGLSYLRKHYPFVFALVVMAGVTVLAIGFAAGYAETFKALYAVVLERVLEVAFGKEKAAAASIVGEAVAEAVKDEL